jgi:GT2 family glycosyltransferase
MLTGADSEALTAGILILNWNGRELLREHLPSVMAAAGHSGIAVAVVDNGSTDDSLGFLARDYPQVLAIPLAENRGFGGGYNAAMRRVPWDVVILLNNDMAVRDDFADHLLEPFRYEDSLFAVSSQIFFQDQLVRREETGRTSARFNRGELQCAHFPVGAGEEIVPVFWLGGGSAAVSREKFETLGGFEELYSPFYVEDVDLSFRAWQRGWPTLLAPRSKVIHKHRGSTGRLDPQYVEGIIARNRLLFVWLNIRDRRLLVQHLVWLLWRVVRRRGDDAPGLRPLVAALKYLPAVLERRKSALQWIAFRDTEILALFSQDREWTL